MTPQSATVMQAPKTSVITKKSEPREAFSRLQRIHDLIERRAFEIFDRSGRSSGHELADWFQAETELLHPVHLEIEESDAAMRVRAEVPGFSGRELDVYIEPRRLTISGKHEQRKEESRNGKTIYSEQCAQEILRSIDLPSTVDTAKVNATLNDGILSIELPKVESVKGLRVEPRGFN